MELQVGVKVLLRNVEGNYLLMRRAPDPEHTKQYKWDMPGGRIHVGTPLMENLAREVMEETGLTMTSEPRLLAAQDLMPNTLTPKHVVRLTYAATADGDVRLSEEHTEFAWMPFSTIAALPDLDSYLKKCIDGGLITESNAS